MRNIEISCNCRDISSHIMKSFDDIEMRPNRIKLAIMRYDEQNTAVDWLNPCQRSRDTQYVCLIDQEPGQYSPLYGQTMQL